MSTRTLILVLALTFAGHAMGDDRLYKVLEVTFDSFKSLEDSHGRTLDGSIMFYFANEGGPATELDEISARGSTFIGDLGEEVACRKALLAAFNSFEERAKRDGATAVVGMRTFASQTAVSKLRQHCLCRVAKNRAATTVKGRLVGSKVGTQYE